MLKKSVFLVAMFLVATNLWAAPPTLPLDVSATRHNFSSTSAISDNYYKATDEDEVCIFCHTPHGGSLNGPLWNRSVPTANNFSHYTSASLSTYMTGLSTTRPVNPESLLCMGCHDGSVGVGTLINNSNLTGIPDNETYAIPDTMWFSSGPNIGGPDETPTIALGKNLTDDHPVSFSYYDASLPTNTDKLRPADGTPANDPREKGIRLFGANAAGGQRMECSSCHNPHVNYELDGAYRPFLVMSNSGSALCLACHIK